MTIDQKTKIAFEIKRLVSLSSGVKVSKKAGVSNATISQIINGNWDLIKDELWRKVKIKLRIELDWITAETTNYEFIERHLKVAKDRGLSFAISDDAGMGKSEAYKNFARNNKNVIYIECKTFWNTKTYAKALVTACGLDDYGTTETLVERFVDYLAELENPIVIIDQMDKLKDGAMDFFIDFYNELAGNCAFCLSGVPAFEKRIRRGVSRDRTGYYELWSRIGRKFLKLKRLTLQDVQQICIANGITDAVTIEIIFENSDNDLRRVRKDIETHFINKNYKNAS